MASGSTLTRTHEHAEKERRAHAKILDHIPGVEDAGQNILLENETGSNFWEPHQYKNVVKRMDDGHRFCTEFQAMLKERSEVEMQYCIGLKQWARKWNSHVINGSQYGTTREGIRCLFYEADQVGLVHASISERLQDNIEAIRQWQKQNYHKTMFGTLKDVKSADKEFKHAQKAWNAQLKKVDKSKREFHQLSKSLGSALVARQNASNDPSLSEEQKLKYSDRVSNLEASVQRQRSEYVSHLETLNSMKEDYATPMVAVFKKCDTFENRRLSFVRDRLKQIVFDLDDEKHVPPPTETFATITEQLEFVSPTNDCENWSQTFGPGQQFVVPEFQPYVETLHEIGRSTSKEHVAGEVTLLGVRKSTTDTGYTNGGPAANSNTNGGLNGQTSSTVETASGDLSDDRRRQSHRTGSSSSVGASRSSGSPSSGANAVGASSAGPEGVVLVQSAGQTRQVPNIRESVLMADIDGFEEENGTPLPANTAHMPMVEEPAEGEMVGQARTPPPSTASEVETLEESPAKSAGATPSKQTLLTNGTAAVQSEDRQQNNGQGINGQVQVMSSDSTSTASSATSPPKVLSLVRALYAYEAEETDELSFKEGDILEMLETEDEMGWCKARFRGKIGLYPATYCVKVN